MIEMTKKKSAHHRSRIQSLLASRITRLICSNVHFSQRSRMMFHVLYVTFSQTDLVTCHRLKLFSEGLSP